MGGKRPIINGFAGSQPATAGAPASSIAGSTGLAADPQYSREALFFDPSIGASAGNIYKTWAEVKAAVLAAPVITEIIFVGACAIPSGAHGSMAQTIWSGKLGASTSVVTIANGATFTGNPIRFSDSLTVINDGAAAPFGQAGGVALLFVAANATLKANAGKAAVYAITGGATVFAAVGGVSTLGDDNEPAVSVDATSTLQLIPLGGAFTIKDKSISGPSGAALNIDRNWPDLALGDLSATFLGTTGASGGGEGAARIWYDKSGDLVIATAVETEAAIKELDASLDAHRGVITGNPHVVTAAETGAEPAFSKNSAFNKNFGASPSTVCDGGDARLADPRPPSGAAGGDLSGTYPNPSIVSSDRLGWRLSPDSNGIIYLLGWHLQTNAAAALTSASPVVQGTPGYHSHTVVDVSAAAGLPWTMRLTGRSIDEDTAVETPGDTEDIPVTANGSFQSVKSWIDAPSISIVQGSKSATIDVYRTTYWDFGNKDFTLAGDRFEFTPGSPAWSLDVKVYHLEDDGTLTTVDSILFTQADTPPRATNGEPGKHKLTFSEAVTGAAKEGLIVLIDQTNIADIYVEVRYDV